MAVLSTIIIIVGVSLILYLLIYLTSGTPSTATPTTSTTQFLNAGSASPSNSTPANPSNSSSTTTVGIRVLKEGTGTGAKDGDTLSVLYTGKLTDGTVFDASSLHGNKPFSFQLGAGQVIKGWDEGLVGMKVNEERQLTIPPQLGYGSNAVGSIPANSTLIFTVTLLKIN